MKITKILFFLFFVFTYAVGFGQKKINTKSYNEFWFSERLSDSLSEKNMPDPSKGFPIMAFLLQKNHFFYQLNIGDELVPVTLKPSKKTDQFYLNIGESMNSHMFDYSAAGKEFLLTKGPNKMLLTINDNKGIPLDSIAFMKPTDFLMSKDPAEIYFTHLISGKFKLNGTDVWFDLEGNMEGIEDFSKWNIRRAAGKISPKVNSPHAFVVLNPNNVKERKSFLVVFDELIKTMNFFKYTVLKDGSYSLEKEPYYILKQS